MADDGVADDGVADDGVADDGVADDGVADDGVADDGVADDGAIPASLRRLGAWVDSIEDAVVRAPDAGVSWVAQRTPLHALVFDARTSFGMGGPAGLRDAMDLAWLSTRAVATGALIGAPGGGRLLLIAPRCRAGEHAEAARAGLENLARTLSVEWARFSVTTVAVCPGTSTTAQELAGLTCFLLSGAGGYYSGCRLDLGGAGDQSARAARS